MIANTIELYAGAKDSKAWLHNELGMPISYYVSTDIALIYKANTLILTMIVVRLLLLLKEDLAKCDE